MKRLAILSAMFLLLSAAPVRAEKPVTTNPTSNISLGEMKATPQMWFYDQELRQYKDPQMAVRLKADQRAQQRMRRLESMRWYGFSNSRPRASSDPYNTDYAPGWVATPGYYPSRWNGVSQP